MSKSATDALFTPLESAPAYVRLAESIEREIISGRIRLLEQSGMLRRDSSRRLQASLPQYQGLATRVSRALVLHETSFRELWEATLSLEAAARHATGEDIWELRG